MKKLMLFVMLCSLFLNSYGQRDPGKLYYDHSKKELFRSRDANQKPVNRPLKYRAHHDLQIEVFNYNPLKYQVIVADSSYNYFLADTALFSKYIGLPAIPAINTSEEESSGKPKPATGTPGKKGQARQEEEKKCTEFITLAKRLNIKANELNAAIADYKTFIRKVETINGELQILSSLPALLPTHVHSSLSNYSLNINAAAPAGKTINTDPNKVNSTQIAQLEEDLYKPITGIWKEILAIEKERSALEDTCTGFFSLYKKTEENLGKLHSAYDEFQKNYTDKIYPGFLKAMETYNEIRKHLNEVPSFTTKAVTIEGDKVELDIYQKTIGKDEKIHWDKITLTPTGGLKLDVSAGIFITNLSDKQYSKTTVDSIHQTKYLAEGSVRDTMVSGTFTSIYEKNGSNVSFGGMIYLHAHSQTGGSVNYGLSLGFGALFNDQARLCMSVGPTILVGKKQRFVINGGIIVSQVDRLTPPYTTQVWYNKQIDNIPVDRVWKAGYSVGFSWNFTTK